MPADLSPLWISLKTALTATLLAALLGIAAARWMVSDRRRAHRWIDGLLTLPLVLPPTVVGFLLLLLLGKNSPVGQLLDQLGITVIFTWTAAVIAATVVAFPLMYKTVLSAFQQIDRTLISSARTLGASEWRIFWQLLLPLAWPGVLAGTVLAFARALGEFGATLMVGGSIPGVTQTMPIAIFFAAEAGRMGVALAWVLLMVAISLVVIAGLNRGDRRSHFTTARPNPFLRRLFDQVYFGTALNLPLEPSPASRPQPLAISAVDFVASGPAAGRAHPAATKPSAAFERSTPDSTGYPPFASSAQCSPVELQVNIEKQIPGFHLQVQFDTGDETLGLLGASGSGKSMTLRCIAGLETPSVGHIILNGRVLFDVDKRIDVPSRDRKVGLVFQNYALFPHLTVAQNIAFGMQALPKPQRPAAVANYLTMMELTGLGDRYPHQLSGGQQQRVALARALAIQPDILLLDEPLSALDTYLRSQIERLLVEVLSTYPGVALFITHKLEEAYRVCTDLLVLGNGRAIAQGPKETIFARPPTYQVAKVTECKNFAHARVLQDDHIEVLEWGCALRVIAPIPVGLNYVGMRAHHIQFVRLGDLPNTFPGWLAMASETQHRVSLYLKLHSPPTSTQDYHLQAEVYRDRWDLLKGRPQPWHIHLDPTQLILLTD